MEFRRVVITGLGTVNPLGNTVEEYWENLKNGVSGAAPIEKFDASKHKTQFACEVKNFDAEMYMERKDARKYDLYTQYAFASTDQAIKNSGLNLDEIDHDRVGVIWGAGIGGLQTFFEEARSRHDVSQSQTNSAVHSCHGGGSDPARQRPERGHGPNTGAAGNGSQCQHRG